MNKKWVVMGLIMLFVSLLFITFILIFSFKNLNKIDDFYIGVATAMYKPSAFYDDSSKMNLLTKEDFFIKSINEPIDQSIPSIIDVKHDYRNKEYCYEYIADTAIPNNRLELYDDVMVVSFPSDITDEEFTWLGTQIDCSTAIIEPTEYANDQLNQYLNNGISEIRIDINGEKFEL